MKKFLLGFLILIFSMSVFAATPPALTKPNISTHDLSAWIERAAIATLNYNYVNYQASQQVASHYFTPEAWQTYQDTLEKSGNLKEAVANDMIITAVPSAAPNITQQGVADGRYTWHVQLPMSMTYQNQTNGTNSSAVINMIVARTNSVTNKSGVAIQQFVVNDNENN